MIKRKNYLAELKLGKKTVKIPSPAYIFSAANRKKVSLFLAVLILAGLVYFLKGQLVVATVNGKPIWRFALITELEKQAGKKVLDSLITKTLILQEAKKQSVTVSEDEINKEVEALEGRVSQQGQNLDELLTLQGMNRSDLREEIQIQKMIEQIVGDDVKVTDQEIDDYIEKNKDFIPEDLSPEEVRENIRGQLKQQKLSEEVSAWISSLKEKAIINYFRTF